MKRKRLKHATHIFGHMFCGWQGIGTELNKIRKLGNGCLRINILTEESTFNNKPLKDFTIAKAINNWFKDDCESNNIDLNEIKKADLIVELVFLTDTKDKQSLQNSEQKWEFRCKGIVETNEKVYESDYTKILDWKDEHTAYIIEK
jgi:hypothetical protein